MHYCSLGMLCFQVNIDSQILLLRMNVERDFNGHAEHLLLYCLDFEYGEFEFVKWLLVLLRFMPPRQHVVDG